MSSGGPATGTTHYLTAETKANMKTYFSGDELMSDCDQNMTPSDRQFLQTRSESMAQLQHNLTLNSRNSMTGALTGSTGVSGSNVILGINPATGAALTYDPRASIYSGDFGMSAVMATPSSNAAQRAGSQHHLAFGSYGNLQHSG